MAMLAQLHMSIITPSPADTRSALVHRVRCHQVAEWSYSLHPPNGVAPSSPSPPSQQLQPLPLHHVELLTTCWAEPAHQASSQRSFPLLQWASSACQEVSWEPNLAWGRRWQGAARGRGWEDQEWVSPGQQATPLAEQSQGLTLCCNKTSLTKWVLSDKWSGELIMVNLREKAGIFF